MLREISVLFDLLLMQRLRSHCAGGCEAFIVRIFDEPDHHKWVIILYSFKASWANTLSIYRGHFILIFNFLIIRRADVCFFESSVSARGSKKRHYRGCWFENWCSINVLCTNKHATCIPVWNVSRVFRLHLRQYVCFSVSVDWFAYLPAHAVMIRDWQFECAFVQ